MQRADLDTIDMPFPGSIVMLTSEESSPWASLMARELPLGPSDAPCPGETSTAHGDLCFWVTALHTGKVTSSCFSTSDLVHAHSLLPPNPITPEMPPSLQISSTSPATFSRRAHITSPSTKANVGFCLAGLEYTFGPLTLQRPKSTISNPRLNDNKPRSVLFNAFSSLLLKTCCSIKDGRRRHSIIVTTSSDETSIHKSQNLTDSFSWSSSDANLILKLFGLVLFSNHRWCEAVQASALLCEHISSVKLPNIKLNNPVSNYMGDASQPSRTFWKKLSRRIEQIYSYKEIPFLQLYSVTGNQTLPAASSMEQFTKSSYASFARAVYDHKLIGDFLKLNFKIEFLKVSEDFPTFASSLKLCILDYSLNLYLFLSCIVLISVCMNLPLLRS